MTYDQIVSASVLAAARSGFGVEKANREMALSAAAGIEAFLRLAYAHPGETREWTLREWADAVVRSYPSACASKRVPHGDFSLWAHPAKGVGE